MKDEISATCSHVFAATKPSNPYAPMMMMMMMMMMTMLMKYHLLEMYQIPDHEWEKRPSFAAKLSFVEKHLLLKKLHIYSAFLKGENSRVGHPVGPPCWLPRCVSAGAGRSRPWPTGP